MSKSRERPRTRFSTFQVYTTYSCIDLSSSSRPSNVCLLLFFLLVFPSLSRDGSYAKDLIKDTIQRNASPVRLEQSGGEKGAIGGSSSSLNSSASDESNRLQHNQQHNSRQRTSLLHSFSTNDASIGEYKYTVTVGNQSLKITGCNLDLVRVTNRIYFSPLSHHNRRSLDFTCPQYTALSFQFY